MPGFRPIGGLPIAGTVPVSDPTLQLGAVETADTTAASVMLVDTITLGATETRDTTAATVMLVDTITLGATETADTTAATVMLVDTITLGATESADVTAVTLMLNASLQLDVTESPDVTSASMTNGDTTIARGPSGFVAYSDVQRVGDTRWQGVREARERARAAFREVAATPVARRKEAAQRASVALADVERAAVADAAISARMEELQALLAGLEAQAQAIRMQQAREAAQMWMMIERELMAEQRRQDDEMMVVLAHVL